MSPEMKVGASLVALVLAVMCWGGVYHWSKADCEERGGHLEWVYGRHISWTCDGAAR